MNSTNFRVEVMFGDVRSKHPILHEQIINPNKFLAKIL